MDRKVSADTAALVAAQLTQAQMALEGGLLAGRRQGSSISVKEHAVERQYLHFLAFVERGAKL